jgi:quercetin dioxygenase-like cupin family protein
MAKDALVSEDLASKFATEKETPYTRWVKNEGLDIISAHYIRSLNTVDLKPWARRGGKGVYINHEASRTSNDCYVCEIAPGKQLEPQRQIFEEMIYVLSGRGSTTVWNDQGHRITFEWQAGALFAIPFNCMHQHFNTGQTPARYLAFKHEVVSVRNAQGVPKAWISRRVGGDQIDYADESQAVRTRFEESLAKHGLTPRMEEAYEAELPTLPPKS